MNGNTPAFVWCKACKRSRPVKNEYAYDHGWPKCCGDTMVNFKPMETEKLKISTGQ